MVYSTLTAVLVVLVAALSFSARQPPPPQIAELTPQAQHQITRAPTQLGSAVGSAKGGSCTGGGPCGKGPGAGGQVTTATAPSTAPPAHLSLVNTAAVHHCFGNPPRQIQDTQSPPCVAYWSGNNGGATSRGVTRSTITVLVKPAGIADQNGTRVVKDLQDFFNQYFELYGRKLHLVPVSNGGGDCATMRAAADGFSQQYQPFATTGMGAAGSESCFDVEMARDHVIDVDTDPWFTEPVMSAYSPYLWEYSMAPGGQLASTGAFICAQLAGRRAAFAPDPVLASRTRKFGLVLEYDQSPYPPSAAPLDDALAHCGAKIAVTETWEDPETSTQASQQSAASFSSQAVLAMKQAGVTTVVCSCLSIDAVDEYLSASAESEDYHPGWLLPSMVSSLQFDLGPKAFWPQADERQGMMGLTFEPAQVSYSDATLNWAFEAVDPGFQIDYSELEEGGYQQAYWQLLLIASGIQMAGPDLGPQSFQRGLQLARFPNPYSPEQEGVVGFPGGTHSMTTDAAAMWWSNTAQSPYPDGGSGAWCYVDGAERFRAAAWSAPMTFFAGPCDSSPPGA